MISFLAVLDKLLLFIQVWYKKQKEKKWQKEQNELESNPAEWFDRHFSGGVLHTDDKTKQTDITDK